MATRQVGRSRRSIRRARRIALTAVKPPPAGYSHSARQASGMGTARMRVGSPRRTAKHLHLAPFGDPVSPRRATVHHEAFGVPSTQLSMSRSSP